MLWENLREEEFEDVLERSHRVCAMAIGCVEKHGQHLPLGTDIFKGGKILELAAEQEEVCVFPRMYFGDVQGWRMKDPAQGFPYGYIALSGELLLHMLREFCDEMARNGFRRILIFSSHGGNTALLGHFLRELKGLKKNYEVFTFYNKLVMPKDILEVISERGREAFPALTDEDIRTLQDFVAAGKFDGHAGFGESAMLMGTYPELIHLDRCEAESGMSRHICDPLIDLNVQWGGTWSTDHPNSYDGHAPLGLTQAIADAAVEISVERTARVLRLLKDDSVMDPIIEAGKTPPKTR